MIYICVRAHSPYDDHRYRLCGRSRKVRESFSCRQAHPRGLWGRGRFTAVLSPLHRVSLNHRQTKRHDRPAYIRQFYAQRFLRCSTRGWYVKSALTALLKQPFYFYKFRITLYSFNGFVDVDEEILTQRAGEY